MLDRYARLDVGFDTLPRSIRPEFLPKVRFCHREYACEKALSAAIEFMEFELRKGA